MTPVTKRCEFWKGVCVTGCNDSEKCDISNVTVCEKWALNEQDFESALTRKQTALSLQLPIRVRGEARGIFLLKTLKEINNRHTLSTLSQI